jgi:hypothetical protein
MNQPRLQFVMACVLSMMMQSERWVPVGGSDNAYQDYLDRESLKRSGNKVTLWTRRNFVTQQRTIWHEIEVDCSSKRDTVLAYVQDDAGTISHNTVRPHRGPTAIPPNSVGARIFDRVCR